MLSKNSDRSPCQILSYRENTLSQFFYVKSRFFFLFSDGLYQAEGVLYHFSFPENYYEWILYFIELFSYIYWYDDMVFLF